jgi:hypothetical protein
MSSLPAWPRRHSVGLAMLATLALHLMWLSRRLGADEGGFAMVARHWHEPGGYLYGPEWVDRPPGLIALFAVADHLGPYGVRLSATILAVALVAALAAAAGAVGGGTAARWSAWAGFAFAASALLQSQRLNGELAGALFVTVSVGALLRAVRLSGRARRTVVHSAMAGVAACVALLMKQDFVDGFVFAGVLVLTSLGTRRNRVAFPPPRVLLPTSGFAAGACVPAVIGLVWASRHGGIGALMFAMFGFRAEASSVMAHSSFAAPLHRLGTLTLSALLSGILVLGVHLAVAGRGRLRHLHPLPWAVCATALVELAGVVGGENYWSHYLIGLIPMVALGAGLSIAGRSPSTPWTRRLVVVAAALTAMVSPVAAATVAETSSAAYTTGRWLADSAGPHDTVVVPFTHVNVIDASGLTPAYPYAWSLPVRALDPRLALLRHTLVGRSAPTWVVRWNDPHAWGLDAGDRVQTALRDHYRPVSRVCGHTVWLHDGLHRRVAAAPRPATCTSAGGPGGTGAVSRLAGLLARGLES